MVRRFAKQSSEKALATSYTPELLFCACLQNVRKVLERAHRIEQMDLRLLGIREQARGIFMPRPKRQVIVEPDVGVQQ